MGAYEQIENQLEQALAMNKILLDALDRDRTDRRQTRRVSIICASVCVVALLLFAGVLGVLASGIQIETTTTETTETTTQTGEGDFVQLNNVDGEQNIEEGGVE